MADERDFEEDAATRQYRNPRSGKHKIPTVQGYRQHRRDLDDQEQDEEQAQLGPEDKSRPTRAFQQAKAVFKGQDDVEPRHDPYPSSNHNLDNGPPQRDDTEPSTDRAQDDDESLHEDEGRQDGSSKKEDEEQDGKSATEAVAGSLDPKEKRKAMKKAKRHGKGREVTDPVTHLPIVIHDQTEKDLTAAPENMPKPGEHHSTATGPQGVSKSEHELEIEREKSQRGFSGMQRVFPPPDFEDTKQELAALYQRAVHVGLGTIGLLSIGLFLLPNMFGKREPIAAPEGIRALLPNWSTALNATLFLCLGGATVLGMGNWVQKKSTEIFDDEVWDSSRREEQAIVNNGDELPESVQWLNSLFGAIWPLINPDLFASLVDQIEDVMQASLPKVIKMVSVDDMGQGSESIRILGVRWLPTGAASRTVGPDGGLDNRKDKPGSDRTDPENAQESAEDTGNNEDSQPNDKGTGSPEQEQADIREGMEAEEGDFVNLELALAYRSRSSGKSLKAKAKNAHLYLKFYLPGGVAVPVWVELRGLIMTMRVRLQLTPDPPFISLCTLTFLGQPKASLSCVPLSKHSLNLMDVPLISSFVQSAIDAALAEYVAPKSLTLNLKDMLVGEDFKKDTTSRGVVWIYIRKASGFKQGDGGIGPMKGSSDSYVTVCWGKFGKPVASTRVIIGQDDPSWNEYASILVTPEEVNAEEKLRVQLWDSDKWTADDDLGRVEVDLKSLMKDKDTCNRIHEREDRLVGQDSDEKMPGSLQWSVGYFAKTRITEKQLEQQTLDENIRDKDQLKRHISQLSEHKLREANKPADDNEVHQQKAQDYREMEDAMIISAPPLDEFPSGVISVQIHNITGLEIQKLQKGKEDDADNEDESEQSSDLPDSYCTIMLNHKKIYKSRTKPKNSKPFFNAGTERFIRDWRTAEVIVSVRDAREREDDPLIGIVYLPLAKIFKKKSQVMENFPLVGGIGFGRARISMVWRSVELKLPRNLLGWNYGTLEIRGTVKPRSGLNGGLTSHRIKIHTNLGRTKMQPADGQWLHKGKSGPDDVFLPVRKRYSSAAIIEFRKSVVGPDRTEAFAVLWLKDLTDDQDETKTLKVWKGGKDNLRRASACSEYSGMEEGEQPLGEVELSVKFWRGLSGYHKGYAAQSKNSEMRDVMECLDTITDEKLDGQGAGDADLKEEHNREGTTATSSNGNEGRGETGGQDGTEDEDKKRAEKLRMHTNDDSSSPEDDSDLNSDTSSSDSDSGSGRLGRIRERAKRVLRHPVGGTAEAAGDAIGAGGSNDPDDGRRGARSEIRDYRDHHKQLHRQHRGVMQWRAAREADHLGGKLSQLKGSVTSLFHHSEKEGGVETEV
ncbi:hypothetical protein SLS62_006776 [Diatrype stigma]|uniref:Meiotically up-regulated gene 190 protein n=1 Tax=Diatrype stigma TaxID=117547 RepID=A0AAN9UQB4_9PEZI